MQRISKSLSRTQTVTRTIFTLLFTLTIALAGVPALLAQSDTGRVVGSVADSSGAVIPGATVTLTNTDNGSVITHTSSATGEFTFPALNRGAYKIDTSMAGFVSNSQVFTLQVQQVTTFDIKLTAGSQSTVVEVNGSAPVVDLSTSSTGEVITGRQVTDLPLGQRNFLQLAALTPGVTRGAYGSDASGVNGNAETLRYADSGGGALVVNGLRSQSNNFLLDGTDNNESLANTIVIFPSPDAIEEFRVTTAVAPAEFGRAGGAIVNTSIKSGTNKIHGTAFAYYRSQNLGAASNMYFNPTGQATPFQRKQIGFAAGGPIWKDKLFIFGDYQALRQSRPQDAGFHNVPTTLMRQGNFTELLGTNATSNPSQFQSATGCTNTVAVNGGIYDPTTCQQFGAGTAQANIIPTNRINSAGLKYLQAFDAPTRAGITQNYFAVRRAITNYNDFNVRLDYRISSKDSIFVRYSYAQDNQNINSLFTNLPAGFASGGSVNHPRAAVGGYTRIFTPNIINEFRFGYIRPQLAYVPPFQGTPVSQNLGIVNANRSALLGGGALIGGSNGQIEYTGDGGPYSVPEKTFQFADAVTYVHKNHTFKVGANIIHREVAFFQGNSAKGYFILGGVNFPGTGRFTGYETSEVLAGFSDYRIGAASTYFTTKNYETGYFLQDDWKISKRLTLNLGVRYDLYTSPQENGDNWANYDPATQQLRFAGVNGNSHSLVNTDTNNVAPRIGFAFDVFGDGKTSLRGGYGIFYFLDRGGINNQFSNNPGFNGVQSYGADNGYRVTFTGQNTPGSNNNNATTATQALPLPVFGASSVTPALLANSDVIGANPNNQNGMVQQYNLQLQQQLDRFTSLTIAYVGNKSDHLATYFNLNAPQLGSGTKTYTNRQNIQYDLNNGTGKYSGLQVSLNRNVGQNLLVTSAYTWSHTLDNSNGAFATGAGGAGGRFFIANGQPQFRTNYGNSDQDQRNVFVGSVVYNLPYGHGQKYGASAPIYLNEILGGWQINSITTVQGGTPFDVNTSGIGNIDNRADVISYKPVTRALVGGTSNANNRTYFTGVFRAPTTATIGGNLVYQRAGNIERNQFFGPGFTAEDIGVFKDFALTERFKLQLRAQAYNLLNTPQFTNPDTDINNGVQQADGSYTTGPGRTFGSISGTRTGSQRQMEFAVRLNF